MERRFRLIPTRKGDEVGWLVEEVTRWQIPPGGFPHGKTPRTTKNCESSRRTLSMCSP